MTIAKRMSLGLALVSQIAFFAGRAAWAEDCSKIIDDAERLACFDARSGSDGDRSSNSRSQTQLFAQAETAVREELKDPESARLSDLMARVSPNVRGEPTQVVCGKVNAKNSYGGYVGKQPFVYFPSDRSVHIVSPHTRDSDVMGSLALTIYSRFCMVEGAPK